MAEFCLDCWNKLSKRNFTEKEYVLSKELDLCEECGQWKPVIIRVRRCPWLYGFCSSLRSKFHK